MRIQHVGLCCPSEDDADRFFVALLGLEKSERKTIPASLARPLFGLDEEIALCSYAGAGALFEVFFRDAPREAAGRIAHACLEVADAGALLERARALGFAITRAPKGERFVTFLDDACGNRFEIKEA